MTPSLSDAASNETFPHSLGQKLPFSNDGFGAR
jgi:hypothetical protein